MEKRIVKPAHSRQRNCECITGDIQPIRAAPSAKFTGRTAVVGPISIFVDQLFLLLLWVSICTTAENEVYRVDEYTSYIHQPYSITVYLSQFG
jgi:hypothetical protein